MGSLIDRISGSCGYLAAVFVLPAIIVSTYEVFARYLFNAPTDWALHTSVSLLVISFVLAGPYILRERQLIRVTFVYEKFGRKARRIVDLAADALTVLWGMVLTYAAGVQAYEAIFRFRSGQWRPEAFSGTWDVPVPAFLRAVLALACLLFLIQAFVNLARTIKHRESPDAD